MAEHGRVYQLNHDFADDTGTDRGKQCDICWFKGSRCRRCGSTTAGCILPSCILVTLLAKLYLRYRKMDLLQGILGMLRPAVVALIASAGASILVNAFTGGLDFNSEDAD